MIDIKELKDAVADGLKVVEKKPEVKEVEVFASAGRLNTYRLCFASNVPCNGLEEPKSNEGNGLSVRVLFKDKKYGFGKEDNDLSRQGALNAFNKAWKDRVLDAYCKGLPKPVKDKPKLKDYHDRQIMNFNEAKAIGLAYDALDASLSVLEKKKVKAFNVTGEVDFMAERMAVANSNGIKEFDESTLAWTWITSIIEGKQDVAGYAFDSGTHFKALKPKNVGREASEKSINLVDAEHVDSGNYKVILGRQAITDLFVYILGFELSLIDFHSTPLEGKLGKRIASKDFSLSDDATIKGLMASKKVSDEGLPTKRTELVREGMLVDFLSNDYYARKHEKEKAFSARNGFRNNGRNHAAEPGISATNLVIEKGDYGLNELMKELKNGVYIDNIWYTYPVHGSSVGDFTATVRGDSFIFRNGERKHALVPNTCRINGNILDLLQGITGLTKKQKPTFVWAAESVIVSPEIAVKSLRIDRIAKGLY
jgi:PmbA protein